VQQEQVEGKGSTNQSFDSKVLIMLKQGKITQVQQRTNWTQFVPFLTSFLKLVPKTIQQAEI
jgi:hypothetical protein